MSSSVCNFLLSHKNDGKQNCQPQQHLFNFVLGRHCHERIVLYIELHKQTKPLSRHRLLIINLVVGGHLFRFIFCDENFEWFELNAAINEWMVWRWSKQRWYTIIKSRPHYDESWMPFRTTRWFNWAVAVFVAHVFISSSIDKSHNSHESREADSVKSVVWKKCIAKVVTFVVCGRRKCIDKGQLVQLVWSCL